jgi:arylsulfatase A-like enzyme
VEELGLKEKTLIIFLSDNGFSCGQHGFWGKGNGTCPRNFYENSVKVPAIFSLPGTISENKVCSNLVSAYDFYDTMLDFLNIDYSIDNNSPGTSFAAVLKGEELDNDRPVVVFDEYGPNRMIRTERWKYVYRHAYGPDELYDMENDPDERTNLSESQEHENLKKNLKEQMDEWFARYVNPARDGLKEDGSQFGQTRYLPE